MAILYKPDGDAQLVLPKNVKRFTLQEMQQIIGGYVRGIKLGDDRAMLIDEDGLAKQLPPNKFASLMFASRIGTPNAPVLVGPVLIGTPFELGWNEED